MQNRFATAALVLTAFLCFPGCSSHKSAKTIEAKAPEPPSVEQMANQWRAEHRLIDMHQHVDFTPEHVARDIRIMDAVGIGTVVRVARGGVAAVGIGTVVRAGTGGSAPAGSGAAAPELSGGRAGERTGRGGALRRGWRRTRCGSRSAAGASSSTATPASSW